MEWGFGILIENRGAILIVPLMFFCVIASVSEAINRVGILCLLFATLALLARNDTWNLVMLSISETSLLDSMLFAFL